MERALHVSSRAIVPHERQLTASPLTPESPITERLRVASMLLLSRFPSLERVDWVQEPLQMPSEFPVGAGAWFVPSEQHPNSMMFLNPLQHQQEVGWVLQYMPLTVAMIAERIGVTVEGIMRYPDIFTVFAYFHEMGHARSFFTSYARQKPVKDAAVDFVFDRIGQQETHLPISDMPPSMLIKLIQSGRIGELDVVLKKHALRLAHMGISTDNGLETLVRRQQLAYRSMPLEDAADRFAGYAIQIFWNYLGFPDNIRVSQ